MSNLPPELHSEIIQYSDHDSVLALAAVCRLLNTIVNRVLYNHVEFDSETPSSTVRLFLDRVSRRQSLAAFVVHLELDWCSGGRPDDTSAMANLLGLTLPKMTALAYLSISPALDIFTWVLDDMTLPALRHLHLYPRNGKFSPSFLDRHPRLTHLTLYPEARPPRNEREVPAAERGQLPNLVHLYVSNTRTLKQVLQRTPSTTLRRLDMTMGNDLRLADLNRLLVEHASALQQLNFWVSRFSPTPWDDMAGLDPLPTVTRLGIFACHPLSSHLPLPRESGAGRLARVFPAVERLELLCGWTAFPRRHRHQHRSGDMEWTCEELCAWTAPSFAALRCIGIPDRVAYVRASLGEPFMRASLQVVEEMDWSRMRWPQK